MTIKNKANTLALASLPQSARMINRPTVVPTDGVQTPGMQVARTDPYYSIDVDTTGQTSPVEVILFDGSQGYQLGFNAAMPLNVTINGKTMPYQYMLNDIILNSSYVDMMRLIVISTDPNIDSDAAALIQFTNGVNIYESSKGGMPRLTGTFYPSMGIHEGQFQKSITTFKYPVTITNRTALVYKQQPNTIVNWAFYQKAEIGRHQ